MSEDSRGTPPRWLPQVVWEWEWAQSVVLIWQRCTLTMAAAIPTAVPTTLVSAVVPSGIAECILFFNYA
jgi:hypothetical protein